MRHKFKWPDDVRYYPRKVFSFGEEVKNNFVGITFDHAKSMTGTNIGLTGIIKENFPNKFIFTLKDPCHGLNLAIKHSMKSLPDQITDFITDLHFHFISPQRTAHLMKIQSEHNNLPKKGLCHYVKTRWLSLGLSLTRILEIWESLLKYMESKPSYSGMKKFDYNKFIKLFKDPCFKLKIIFLESVIKKINETNKNYQTHALEIQHLLPEMTSCVKELADIFLLPKKLPEDFNEISKLPWTIEGKIKEYFRSDEDLIERMELELNKELKEIKNFSIANAKDILSFCLQFLQKIVQELIFYFPLEDKIIKTFDLVNLPIDKGEFKKKLIDFNRIFKVSDDEQTIIKEVNELYKQNFQWARSNSSLQLWAWIESTMNQEDVRFKKPIEAFPNLATIIRTAHVMPTSSATVEQSFSTLKLTKSSLRSRLKEETAQCLMLMKQEYDPRKEVQITDRLLEIYTARKEERKKNLESPQKESENTKEERKEETKEVFF